MSLAYWHAFPSSTPPPPPPPPPPPISPLPHLSRCFLPSLPVTVSECSAPCSSSSCLECLHESNCLWCPSLNQCISGESGQSYALTYPFGQCLGYVSTSDSCPRMYIIYTPMSPCVEPHYLHTSCPMPPYFMSHASILHVPHLHTSCPMPPYFMSHTSILHTPYLHTSCPIPPYFMPHTSILWYPYLKFAFVSLQSPARCI